MSEYILVYIQVSALAVLILAVSIWYLVRKRGRKNAQIRHEHQHLQEDRMRSFETSIPGAEAVQMMTWICPHCTYLNPLDVRLIQFTSMCENCQLKKPPEAKTLSVSYTEWKHQPQGH